MTLISLSSCLLMGKMGRFSDRGVVTNVYLNVNTFFCKISIKAIQCLPENLKNSFVTLPVVSQNSYLAIGLLHGVNPSAFKHLMLFLIIIYVQRAMISWEQNCFYEPHDAWKHTQTPLFLLLLFSLESGILFFSSRDYGVRGLLFSVVVTSFPSSLQNSCSLATKK